MFWALLHCHVEMVSFHSFRRHEWQNETFNIVCIGRCTLVDIWGLQMAQINSEKYANDSFFLSDMLTVELVVQFARNHHFPLLNDTFTNP